jgi:hypothetical protein
MQQHSRGWKRSSAGWLWIFGAVAPLVTVGCGSRPADRATDQPRERVAGERTEERLNDRDEANRIAKEAGLPAKFAFGGRTWQAHDVHWAAPEDVKRGAPGTTDADSRPDQATEPKTDAGRQATEAMDMDDFVAMANLKVNGAQIYRKKGADEAFTDNIFLKAATSGGRTAFIECDAMDNWMDNADLGRVLKAASLPQSVKWGGKTWKADKIQVYDADVFDDLKPVQGGITGVTGFQGEDRDMLLLQGNLPAGAAIAEKDADGTDADKDKEAIHGGPIFVRYEEARR